jgi:hypothetical protein
LGLFFPQSPATGRLLFIIVMEFRLRKYMGKFKGGKRGYIVEPIRLLSRIGKCLSRPYTKYIATSPHLEYRSDKLEKGNENS